MRRFYLLGVFLAVVLTGCMTGPEIKVSSAENDARKETLLVFSIRSAQANYEDYLKTRAETCKSAGQILVRDGDGILTCAVAPKKTEENK